MTCGAGIEVEVVTPAPQAAPRIPASEDLGAPALFHSYATTVGMSQPALEAALELLRVGSSSPGHASLMLAMVCTSVCCSEHECLLLHALVLAVVYVSACCCVHYRKRDRSVGYARTSILVG